MRMTLLAIAAAAATTACLGFQPADAKEHPRVVGLSCSTVARSARPGNVWHAFFYGEKETLFDQRWPFTASPCFHSQADCQNWLYWAQTDYPLEQEVRWCHRGLG